MFRVLCRQMNNYEKTLNGLLPATLLVGLYFTTRVNYLLFHSLVEIFSIVVAFSISALAWHSQKYTRNQYLLFIGIAYLFTGFLDLLHTLSYTGMPIFTDYDYYANQLWIGARFIESLSLLIAFQFIRPERKVQPYCLLTVYSLITAVLVMSIFTWKIFPECFVVNQGLTPFKKVSEYVICIILAFCIYFLVKHKDRFESSIYRYLLMGFIFTIISELAFTFYISNYGISNLVGHYFKLFSFYMVYMAIIATGIENPFNLIFLELERTNKQLTREIETRKQTERELTTALSEVKTLSGLLPICASCKNIRDDKGYWRQIEAFIKDHAEVDFSHGICPECAKKLYPEYVNENGEVR